MSKNADSLVGIEKIQHVVIIMQENRSFDSYFGSWEFLLAPQKTDDNKNQHDNDQDMHGGSFSFAFCEPSANRVS